MYHSFELKIELGNDAMQDQSDIANALREVADRLDRDGGYVGELMPVEGNIRDVNGNRVGEYALVEVAS